MTYILLENGTKRMAAAEFSHRRSGCEYDKDDEYDKTVFDRRKAGF